MKLVTWNVRWGNRQKRKGIKFIFSLNPDVVSLQEVPYKELKYLLKEYPNYIASYAFDCTGKSLSKSCFVVVMSKVAKRKSKTGRFSYFDRVTKSFMYSVLYKRLAGNTEQHISPFIRFEKAGKIYCFYAARFSTAVGPGQRLNFLKTFPNSNKKNINMIIGDLNVGSGVTLGFLSGIFRNYSFKEMITNERVYFDKIVESKGYVNPFSGKKTTQVPFFNHQFDHILLPNTAKVVDLKTFSGAGSDHKILFSEISLG